ncbi:glycosyltransferase [Micromonospora fiedleri]|uniref:Glycosyltransferase n=1 Tax=Micromonospora fiedleri TaxID=1157498 RepID=A0ABS1UV25_9ACTN|nr:MULTISPECIES: glycosyltransferase [Micromonospora]MBL6279503.1 glycosyltransferase [Micromonospora fiedleri]WSK44862.1 glycosyltransferase [Micromonospora maris]
MNKVVDLSGGPSGGSGRFREQCLRYLAEPDSAPVRVLGADRRVTARWLLRRELMVRSAARLVSTNNVGFATGRGVRVTLVRNANHFLTEQEWARSKRYFRPGFAAQIAWVRAGLRRADVIVVPSSSMAERVGHVLPGVRDRVVVRFHPLRQPARTAAGPDERFLLCPIVDSPFKRMRVHLTELARVLPSGVRVVSTMRPDTAPPELRDDPRFRFVGVLDRDRLAEYYARCAAVYYPTAVESFGYPLAEARSAGIPVIAQDSAHNHEIAALALHPFDPGHSASLRDAVEAALHAVLTPDPEPFAADSYFDWLFDHHRSPLDSVPAGQREWARDVPA